MLIRLEGNQKFEEISEKTKPLIGQGEQGGKIYAYRQDECIKILNPENHITEINVDYFIENIKSPLLLSPKRKGYDDENKFRAYLAKYIIESKSALSQMSPDEFMKKILLLKEAIHSELSENKIAIFDGNNYIIGKDGNIYLCDFDMYKTPFSPEYLLYQVKENYHKYNENAFNELIYSILQNEVFKIGQNRHDPKIGWEFRKLEREFPNPIEYIKRKVKRHQTIKAFAENFRVQ